MTRVIGWTAYTLACAFYFGGCMLAPVACSTAISEGHPELAAPLLAWWLWSMLARFPREPRHG